MEVTCQALAKDTAPDLLKAFCNYFHLPLEGSQLFHHGAVLTKETVKQVSRSR